MASSGPDEVDWSRCTSQHFLTLYNFIHNASVMS